MEVSVEVKCIYFCIDECISTLTAMAGMPLYELFSFLVVGVILLGVFLIEALRGKGP